MYILWMEKDIHHSMIKCNLFVSFGRPWLLWFMIILFCTRAKTNISTV